MGGAGVAVAGGMVVTAGLVKLSTVVFIVMVLREKTYWKTNVRRLMNKIQEASALF